MTLSRPLRPGAHPCALSLAALAILSLAAGLAPGLAHAAPEEVEVYRDEVTPRGGFGVEVNQNYVFSGSHQDAATGALGPVHLYRMTPELDYGFARGWEAGLLAITTVRNGEFDAHGVKVHVRWILPHPEERPWYGGFNLEVGWTDRHLEERPVSAELRGVFGYEGRRWIVALNPTVETAADDRAAEPVSFELQSKIGYRVAGALILGLESYNAFGPVQSFGPLRDQPQMLYATADYAWRGLDLNVGIGRGLTGASDGWAIKTVIGIPLGRH